MELFDFLPTSVTAASFQSWLADQIGQKGAAAFVAHIEAMGKYKDKT